MIDYVISFIAPLAYFLFFTATLVQITKKSFGKCLPIGMMLSAFLLFFSQLIFNTFWVGFIIGILFAIAAIPILLLKREKWNEFKKLYFTSGMVVFLVIYIAVYIYDLNRGFMLWDELSHWGMMVKEMVRLDKFYSVDESNLMVHKDYPPIMQLFELFWIKLCGGGMQEPLVARALHTFELSLFVPFIAEKVAEKRNFWKSILVGLASIAIVMLVMLVFDGHGIIGAVYVDYVMAILVVFLLMTVLACKKITWFEIFTISLGGSFLLLLKQMGLPLYSMVICFLLGIVWLRKDQKIKKYLVSVGVKRIVLYTVLLVIPFILWVVWGRMVSGSAQQFELSDLSVSEFVKILMGKGEAWQTFTVQKYINALGQSSISTSFIQMSFLQSVVLFVGLMCIVKFLFRKTIEKKEIVFATVIVLVGAVGYAVAMLMLYVLSFGSLEGPKLASYERYMGTYAIIMMLFVVMILIWQATLKKRNNLIYGAMIIAFLVNTPSMYRSVYPNIFRKEGPHSKYAEEARLISDVVKPDESVYLITRKKGVSGEYHFFVQYYGNPIRFNWRNWEHESEREWPVDEDTDTNKYYTEVALPDIVKFDYLLVAETEKDFEKKYCNKLKICPLEVGNIYKVILNDDGSFNRFDYVDNIYNRRGNE